MPREKKPRLKRRADGRYRCKYKDKYFYGNTPEEAIELRNEYKRNEQAGRQAPQTVSDYALPWLKRTYPAVADCTYSGYAVHIQHLVDEIGEKRLDAVLPSDIKNIYSTCYRDCSNYYLIKAKQLFVALLDAAVADRLISSNPARDKTAKPHKGSQSKTRSLTKQEREWVETLCKDHRAYPVVMTMLYAGLRPQEAKALKIDRDVNFETDIITVRETAHKNGRRYAFTAHGKTDKANRQVPLFPPLKAVLSGKKGHLVQSAHGQQITESSWGTLWASYLTQMETAINGMPKRWYGKTKEHKAILKAGGKLPDWIEFNITPYYLRHTFCAWCRDNGVEMNTCRRWMGHADPKMILKVYDSVSDDRSDQEQEKLVNLLFGGQNGGQNKNKKPEAVDNKEAPESEQVTS